MTLWSERIELNGNDLTTGGRPVHLAWLWRPLRDWQTVRHPHPPVREERHEYKTTGQSSYYYKFEQSHSNSCCLTQQNDRFIHQRQKDFELTMTSHLSGHGRKVPHAADDGPAAHHT